MNPLVVMMQAENKWAAVGPDWYRGAACKNTNADQFTPAVETPKLLEEVKQAFCDHCPVRERCLQFAIINGDRGFWGGTSTAERTALKRTRSRAKCPMTACRAPEPVVLGLYQVCLRCGASWQAERSEDAPVTV
jgi:WhiB family redox-sensing transcriptional regulator